MAKISGSVLYVHKEYFLQRYGEEGYQAVLNHMDEQAREALSRPIQSAMMYDVHIFQELLRAIENVHGRKEVANSSIDAARRQIKGFFGLMLNFVSAERVLRQGGRMWRKAYDSGELEVTKFEGADIVITIRDFRFTDIHRYGQEIFLREIISMVLKKDILTSNSKAIDETTTDFDFTVRET